MISGIFYVEKVKYFSEIRKIMTKKQVNGIIVLLEECSECDEKEE